MQITDVKIFLKEGQDKKLKAYATITFDNVFVVRNVKIIDGNKGLFVAMPSRKLKDPCPKCNFRNTVRSRFCNQCGASLPQAPQQAPAASVPDDARQSEHKDIAHPITAECRDYIQKKVLEAYDWEKKAPSAPQATAERTSRASSGASSASGASGASPASPASPASSASPAAPAPEPRHPIAMEDEDIEL
jgi:stage V sporulation protein G